MCIYVYENNNLFGASCLKYSHIPLHIYGKTLPAFAAKSMVSKTVCHDLILSGSFLCSIRPGVYHRLQLQLHSLWIHPQSDEWRIKNTHKQKTPTVSNLYLAHIQRENNSFLPYANNNALISHKSYNLLILFARSLIISYFLVAWNSLPSIPGQMFPAKMTRML